MLIRHIFILVIGVSLAISCKPRDYDKTGGHSDSQPQETEKTAITVEEPPAPAPVPEPTASMAIVQVTHQAYNQLQPWQKEEPSYSRGFVIYLGEGRFLTVERVIRDATFLELISSDGSKTVPASVAYSDPESGLSLITVKNPDDASFFSDMVPVPIGKDLPLNSTVQLWQFSDEGLPLVADGTILSAEPFSADNDSPAFLYNRIRAALNPVTGGATIPVISDGKLAGISLNYKESNQRAVTATVRVINGFLNNAAGNKPGFPVMGIQVAPLTDPVFREYLKLAPSGNGIYITNVVPHSSAARAGVKKGDVLESINGHAVDNRGLTRDPLLGPVPAGTLMHDSQSIGDTIHITIRRDGKPMELSLKMDRDALDKDIISLDRAANAVPPYIIYGGFVFQKFTDPYIKSLKDRNDGNMPMEFLELLNNKADYAKEEAEEIVIIGPVLPTPATLGYNNSGFCAVKKINGVPVKSLAHLAELLNKPGESDIIEIETNKVPFKLYVSRSMCDASNDALQRRAIPVLRRLPSSQQS